MKNININGQDVPLKFGYGLLRALGEAWGCTGVQGVFDRFQAAIGPFVVLFQQVQAEDPDALDNVHQADLPFDTIDVFADVLHFASLKGSVSISKDACADFLLQNIHEVGMLTQEFIASMPVPKPEPEGKQSPPIVPAGEA